jgi:murein L,D-transpeptidase YcbB/YkuD
MMMLLIFILGAAGVAPPQDPRDAASALIHERVQVADTAVDARARFYTRRDYRPAWSDSTGQPVAAARRLLDALAHAPAVGLDSSDYAVAALDRLLAGGDAAAVAGRDLALSAAFLRYAADLATGRVDPATLDTLWRAADRDLDLAAALARAVAEDDVAGALAQLAPPQPGFSRLQRALWWYRAIAASGGWTVVPPGPDLSRGERGERVDSLRARLAASGDLAAPLGGPGDYDAALERAVRRFQGRHGLPADGVAGAATLAALNVPAAERAATLALNLERWRWLPRELGTPYLVVNAPAFLLEVIDSGRTVMTVRAIIGRSDWPTPITDARLIEVDFHPHWNIPRAIAIQEVVPLARADARYLARQRIRVWSDSGGGERDPAAVDWAAVTESTFAYHLVQDPGPANPLGNIRFLLLDSYNVAIHDTPGRELFGHRVRLFSHGCVRIQRAADLAIRLLGAVPGWPADSVRAALAAGDERRVPLPRAVRTLLVYRTGWVDDDGVVQFRDDVYGWDAKLREALSARSRPTAQHPGAGAPQAPPGTPLPVPGPRACP